MRIATLIGGLAAGVALAAAPASTAQATVPGPVAQGEVKWVLPPTSPYSIAYHNIKHGPDGTGGVVGMGYETVENDDPTYPDPRR
jgi:hypothetical protein